MYTAINRLYKLHTTMIRRWQKIEEHIMAWMGALHWQYSACIGSRCVAQP